jgi:pyruvate/2-oxoglutarate dehydrogenase complex dihydrolipoamide acyltransferase (E2) component
MMEASGISASLFAGLSVVRKQDVLDFLNPPVATPAPIVSARACPAPTKINQPYKEVPLSKMKRSEGANLAAGVANAVSSAITVGCYTRGLRELIDARMDGGNASAVIVYEVSRLLRKYPTLNAAYRNGAMLLYEQVNVGFAMDDGRGLKVAVLSNCDTLSLHQVTERLRDLTVTYLDDKLGVSQISNATFTISDLAGMGVSSFLPLISENQSGILGIGGEQFAPDSRYGFFNMTLAFDHQLSDGRIASLFLNDLKERLQSYENTLLGNEAKQKREKELCCSRCFRSLSTLKSMDRHLFVLAEPDGYLCTLCAEGY